MKLLGGFFLSPLSLVPLTCNLVTYLTAVFANNILGEVTIF